MRPVLCIIALLLIGCGDAGKQTFIRMYECLQGNRCQRTSRPIDPTSARDNNAKENIGLSQHTSLQACRLVCSHNAGLWPLPTGPITTGSNYLSINPRGFQFLNVNDLDESARAFVLSAVDIFLRNIQATCGDDCRPVDRKVVVHLKVESSSLQLDWETNEGYNLEISTSGSDVAVLITAQTVFGARHGLETLSQLTASTPSLNNATDTGGNELVILDSANIKDKPVYKHRGLLIDTARNFLPVPSILRTIDALASAKMNVLHWHATDSQSFPIEIRSMPLMAMYGAYAPDKIYSAESMKMIVKYAKSRGVRIILELDSPSHAGAGWDWGDTQGLGNLAVCVNQQPWRDYCIQPPCGQLNPVNPNTFSVLRSVYKDLLSIFGRAGVMHLGGDELFVNCWNATEEVTDGMSKMGLGRTTDDFLKIWATVHNKQLDMINEESEDQSTNKAIVWSSLLSSPEQIENYLNKTRFVVQTWVESDKDLNKRLLDLGYKLIISTKDAWYLDHGFWGVTKYHTWRDAYNNQIPNHDGVLGGEACMWGEYVTEGSLDARVWPRTAAVGERLWSNPSKLQVSTAEAEPRLQAHIARLNQRRISAEAIAPEWCNQHEGQCL